MIGRKYILAWPTCYWIHKQQQQSERIYVTCTIIVARILTISPLCVGSKNGLARRDLTRGPRPEILANAKHVYVLVVRVHIYILVSLVYLFMIIIDFTQNLVTLVRSR